MLELIFIAIVYVIYRAYLKRYPHPSLPADGKWVLISGCDTGFGNMTTKQLDALGYHVLAGCLTQDGAQKLSSECSKNVVTFQLDITNEESVAKTKALVEKHANGKLWGIVNNAGISAGTFVEWNTPAHYKRVHAVNFMGHVDMIYNNVHSIIKAKGRIVNITSVAGFMAAPGMSAYASSKHAFEGYSDSLRREMYLRDVKVAIIEPGFMNTAIVQQALQPWISQWESLSQTVKDEYGQPWFDQMMANRKIALKKNSDDPQLVVDSILHALTNSKPEDRYRPGFQAKLIYVANVLPTSIADYLVRRIDGRDAPLFAQKK
ncbi:retinol dehydrogenase, retinaldehyde reductase [Planoprotostelium fungivorum]|uniref:Retinol dehydrogenase, retinaldehyde reductase n=1 Tax=Planoprotostelium fungivorum TaxID=1890364 RepID=A0A2P6NKZ2_9EUKA|nr:retinol dehydrogenase, retinaldehyde reductase [Planoprotostelium fungivorum]